MEVAGECSSAILFSAVSASQGCSTFCANARTSRLTLLATCELRKGGDVATNVTRFVSFTHSAYARQLFPDKAHQKRDRARQAVQLPDETTLFRNFVRGRKAASQELPDTADRTANGSHDLLRRLPNISTGSTR